MLLPNDHGAWRQHFFIEHGLGDGTTSVRFIEGEDWTVEELTQDPPAV